MARIRRAVGPEAIERLAYTTFGSSAADAFVAVSLAGSLFFNLSIDAARPRIILYLAVTMAPFAVVAPLIGPFVDRIKGGHRVVIVAACVLRAVLCLTLAFHLRSLFLYPLAFTILVLNKTHAVAKSALVPRLITDHEKLVASNAALSRVAAVAGAVGGVTAASILGLFSAPAVLWVGAAAYGGATVAALTIRKAPRPSLTPGRRFIEAQELRNPTLVLGLSSMALVRGAVGYFAFFAAFTLKAAGEPTWVFGAVAAAGGIGGFAATFIGPALRRLLIEEHILEVTLIAPAVVALLVPKGFVTPSLLVVALVLGMAASLARQGFDSLVQREAPDAERGRTFARFEARLQLTWVVGALLPVLVRPSNVVGLYLLGGVLAVGAVAFGTGARAAVRRRWGQWSTVLPVDRHDEEEDVPLPAQLVATARWLADRGSDRQAIAVAAAALDAVRRTCVAEDPRLTDALLEMEGMVVAAAAPEDLGEGATLRAIELAAACVELCCEGGPPPAS
ncbi:MFS transporter [Actinomarinicola tropica]|uniref:MFS transporter n=1 Tax=Actinomarinicola tropica TaxID=2789776 RepID=UPI00189BAD76|nr:MFS transporter [Actinomarinicola tropica]